MLTYARCLSAGAVAAIPVLALAAGPYLFQETFDDGSVDGILTSFGSWGVVSGELRIASGGFSLVTKPVSAADYDAAATVRFTNDQLSYDAGAAGVMARFQGFDRFYYALLEPIPQIENLEEPPRQLAIYKVSTSPIEADSLFIRTDGGCCQHLLGGVEFPIQRRQNYDLNLRVVGDTLSVSVDGVEIFTVVDHDDAYMDPGRTGLIVYRLEAVIDNWRVQARKTSKR